MPSLEKPFLLQVTECVGSGLLMNFLCCHFSRFAVPVLCPESAIGGLRKKKVNRAGDQNSGPDFTTSGKIHFGLILLVLSIDHRRPGPNIFRHHEGIRHGE
jgi:hypothetical protein